MAAINPGIARLLSKVDRTLPDDVKETEEWKRLRDILERIETVSTARCVEKELLNQNKEEIEKYFKNDLASEIGRYLLKEGVIMVQSQESKELCSVNYRADVAVVIPKKKEDRGNYGE